MTEKQAKLNIFGKDLDQISDIIVSLGHNKFRAKQIFNWIYIKSAKSFHEMSDLPKSFQEELEKNYSIGSLTLIERQVSSDGTKKYLFALEDGSLVESVLMYFEGTERLTACISSQIGCAVKCPFCSTGTLGFKKNLRDDEILEQVQFIQNLEQERISNIVFMGQGEPLNNYKSVVSATQKLRELIGIGARHITISTSGVIPQIDKLAEEKIQLTLALSLHDPDDNDRDFLVPINKKWKIAPLMESLRKYVKSTNRRVTIEYVLLKNLNDSDEKAKRLGELVSNLHCNINLIPYNQSCSDTIFLRPDDKRINNFAELVKQHSRGKTVTVRQEKGHDIKAACGQLESSYRDTLQSI